LKELLLGIKNSISDFKTSCIHICLPVYSIVKRGGYFQWHLSVCLFVYQHDNVQMIKRWMMKLGG